MKKNEAYKKLEKSVLLGDLLGTKHFLDKVDNVDYTDEFGRTLVYYAIKENFQEILCALLDAGAKLNVRDKKGKTPLHFACIFGKLPICQLLIERGINVNTRDIEGNSALFDAIFHSKGRRDIILLLLENGADSITPNNHDVTPKSLAAMIANFDVSDLF